MEMYIPFELPTATCAECGMRFAVIAFVGGTWMKQNLSDDEFWCPYCGWQNSARLIARDAT